MDWMIPVSFGTGILSTVMFAKLFSHSDLKNLRDNVRKRLRDLEVDAAERKRLEVDLQKLKSECNNRWYNTMEDGALVTCDKCGCAVRKCDAVRGEKYVHEWTKQHYYEEIYGMSCVPSYTTKEECVKTRYYCKMHAPKKKEAK